MQGLKSVKRLEILEKGIKISIVDARSAKPLDEKLILELAANHELILTIEEGSIEVLIM